ncbi:Trifunctional nucleotide phosphoesterase protein YfkN precursor [compost metagenome]
MKLKGKKMISLLLATGVVMSSVSTGGIITAADLSGATVLPTASEITGGEQGLDGAPIAPFTPITSLSLEAAQPFGLTDIVLPDAQVESSYSVTLDAYGGVAPYHFTADGLPQGLAIDNSTGVISGVPAAGTTGKHPLTLTIQDSSNPVQSLVAQLDLTVGQAAVEPTRDVIDINKIASYSVGTTSKDGGVAEIVKFNKDNGKFYLVNGSSNPPSIDIVTLTTGTLSKDKTISVKELAETDGFQYGDLTSVDINTVTDKIAVAVQEKGTAKQGKILVLDYEGNLLQSYAAGVQPDMVKYTSDGRYILTADEGEPREEGVDPEGSVTIVDTLNNDATQAVTHVKFDNPNVIDDLVHIRGASNSKGKITGKGTKADALHDLEPEFISLSADEATAYVSLQENNAIAVIDIASKTVTAVKGLGFKDFNDPKNALDLINDGVINLENAPFLGMYMPDGIATYSVDGQTYLLTANEGDATEWPGRESASKVSKLVESLNPASDAAIFLKDKGTLYDKLEAAGDMGTEDIYLYGGRSFSIWNAADMTQVYDSGSDFERVTAERLPDYFNTSNSKVEKDDRSTKKGPEPEYVAVGKVGGKTLAFVGLERIGGVMTYDVTNPQQPVFMNYVNTREFDKGLATDTGPEGLEFIEAKDSPTGRPLLLVANEVGGTVAVLELDVTDDTPESDTWELTVMHTNDTHAHLADVARRTTLVNKVRNEGGNSLLLDAGDVFSGDLYFTKWFGMADLAFMNYMGYDAMTFGNHEFDQGTRALADFIKSAKFPLVSSNIDFSKDENIASLVKSPITINTTAQKTTANAGVYPYVVLDVDGVKVGVFGMTTEDTAETSSPGKNVTFKDAQESAQQTVQVMEQEGLKHIIALSHLGYGRDKLIADTVEGIDLIVGGHTHTKLSEPEIIADSINGTPTVIVQANEWGKFLGRVDLVFDKNGVVQTGEGQTTGQLITVEGNVAEDATAKEMLAPYNAELEELKKQVIGVASVVLDGERKNVRSKETNLGNLIADGMLSKAKQLKNADIAIMNGGGIRASIDEGDITMGELRTVMPFGNTLFVLDVTGQQLKDGLENGISGAKLADLPGKFPQVAGMKFKWDPNGAAGSKVFDMMIQRESGYEPINLTSTYRLATNSFVANGGDGYASFAAAIASGAYHEDLGYPDYEIFMEYVDSLGGSVLPKVEGRIVEQAKPSEGGGSNGGGSGNGNSNGGSGGISSPGSVSTTPGSGQNPAQGAANILSGNQLQVTEGKNSAGQKVQQVTVSQDVLAAAAAQAVSNAKGELVIDLSNVKDGAEVTLPVQSLGLNASSGNGQSLIVVIKTALSTYHVPVQSLGQSGNILGASDSKLRISINPVTPLIQEQMDIKAAALGASLVIPSGLEFRVALSGSGQEQVIHDFGKTYASRIIPLPSSVNLNKAAAVMYDEKTGKFRFVPSTRVTLNGQPALEVKSPGNGIFTVIEYSKMFDDLKNHWAKADIEALASKWIVQGVSENQYNPSQPVTKAEFAALLARSLGLVPDAKSNIFSDVAADGSLAGEIGAAVKIGLIQGNDGSEGQRLGANSSLSRSEMAVMIARAIRILEGTDSTAASNQNVLTRFKDSGAIPSWAAQDIAWLVEQGLMKGTEKGSFIPNGSTTRAEAAVILVRTLKALDLID